MPSSKEKRAQRHQSQSKQNITRFSNRGKVTEKVAGIGYRETQLIGGKKYYSALSDDPNIALGGSTTNNVTVIGDSTGVSSHSMLTNLSIDDHPQYLLVDGSRAMTGDLSLGGGDGALTFTVAGENSIKIPDDQASALIIEEANTAYLTFTTTNSGEKITLGKKLEAGSVEIEGSNFDINGGQIDGVSINTATINGGLGWSASQDGATFTNIDINSGAIDGTPIGANSANTGVFTTLTATTLGGALNVNNENLTNVDIDSGAIDGTTIGATSHTTIKGTTIDATTDFTIDGLVLTADTITNDADLTITASSKIVLNSTTVGIGDGDTNLSGYGVNARILTVLDEGTAGDYGAIEIGGYRTNDGLIGDLNFLNTNGSGVAQSRAIIRGLRDGANDAMALSFFTEATGGNVTERLRIASDGSAIFKQTVDGEAYISLDNIEGAGSSVNESAALRLNLGDGSNLRGGAKVTAKKELDYSSAANMDASMTLSVLQNNGYHDAVVISGGTGNSTFYGNAFIHDGINNIIELDGADPSITIRDETTPADNFKIDVGAKAATTISTVDSTGAVGHLTFDVDGNIILDASAGNTKLQLNGTSYGGFKLNSNVIELDSLLGDFILDSEGDITLDAAGDNIYFKDAGTERFRMDLDSTPTLAVTGDFTLDGSGTIALSADGDAITMDDGTNTRYSFGVLAAPKLDVTGNFIIDGTGDITIDGASGVTIKEDGQEVIHVDTNRIIHFNDYTQTGIYNMYGWNNQADKYHFTSGKNDFEQNYSVISMFEQNTTSVTYPV